MKNLLPFLMCLSLAVTSVRGEDAAIDFNRQIRPILSDRCFACHGPDQQSNTSGLRLDTPEGAYAALKSGDGVAIVAGNPEKSIALQRMMTDDKAKVMPPPSAKLAISDEEIALIRRWIEQGAEYQPHWAFVAPPKVIETPRVLKKNWVRDGIDTFVLNRLEQEGLSPSNEASRARWLRRVTYDLTGLPPTHEEVDAFLKDQSPEAYEKVVERLLASPRFGEKMVVSWIDAARYADSYGYQSDQMSPTWPWRDWAIRAFNSNLPYDQFITQQVAGDMLPGATREQRLGTAFNRLHRMTNEGGSIAEEWRVEGVADRVHTFGTSFLGLTLECARCHDHKYDPITQSEYYQLFAYFNSIDEWGLYDFHASHIVPTPTLLLPNDQQEKRLTALRSEVETADKALDEAVGAAEEGFGQWLESGPGTLAMPDLIAHYELETLQFPNVVEGGIGNAVAGRGPAIVEGKNGKAVKLSGDDFIRIPLGFRLARFQPFTISFWMRDDKPSELHRVILQQCNGTDPGPRGIDLLLTDGKLTARMFRHWPGNAIAIETNAPVVAKGQWLHVTWTYDGSSSAEGMNLYLNGQLADTRVLRNELLKVLDNGSTRDHGGNMLVFGQRFRDRGFKGGLVDDIKIVKRAASPVEVMHLHDGRTLTEAEKEPRSFDLRPYYLSNVDKKVIEKRNAYLKSWQTLVNHENSIYEIAVMEDMHTPRPTHILARGEYDAPRNEKNRVYRDVPEVFPSIPEGSPNNRLGLARWLTSQDHPLTARVAVNRFWQEFFGTGLVATSENFGQQGALPTHPDLLDYLARDFMDSGWDMKRLCRKIVLSATYRQDSGGSAELFKIDPKNDLLARGPSHRLTGEMIRDTALFASGLLVEKQGGPPVYPYQPPGLWRESNAMSPAYRQGSGENLYRRSVYTVWKRTAPIPNMVAFDAANRETCVAKRETTNTPLQALVLLNDVQFVEASRVLAQKMLTVGGDTDENRITFAFLRLTGREPSKIEMTLLLELYDEQRAYFAEEPSRAEKLTAIGQSKPPDEVNKLELAATTVIAQTILNLDATIWKR